MKKNKKNRLEKKRLEFWQRKELAKLVEQQKKEMFFDNRHSIYGINNKIKA